MYFEINKRVTCPTNLHKECQLLEPIFIFTMAQYILFNVKNVPADNYLITVKKKKQKGLTYGQQVS